MAGKITELTASNSLYTSENIKILLYSGDIKFVWIN